MRAHAHMSISQDPHSYEEVDDSTWRYVDSPDARGRHRKQSPFFDIKSSHTMIMNMSKDGDSLMGNHSEHGPRATRYTETSFTRPHTSTGLYSDFYDYDGYGDKVNTGHANRKSNVSPFTSINEANSTVGANKLAAYIPGAPRTPPLPIHHLNPADKVIYKEGTHYEKQQPIPYSAHEAALHYEKIHQSIKENHSAGSVEAFSVEKSDTASVSQSAASVSAIDDPVEMWSAQMSTSNENRNFFFPMMSGSGQGQESGRQGVIGNFIDRNSKGNLFMESDFYDDPKEIERDNLQYNDGDFDLEHSEQEAQRHSADSFTHDKKSAANRFESRFEKRDNRLDISIRSEEGDAMDRTHYFEATTAPLSLLLASQNCNNHYHNSNKSNSSNESSTTISAHHSKIIKAEIDTMREEVTFVETLDLYEIPVGSNTSSPNRSGHTSPNTSSEVDTSRSSSSKSPMLRSNKKTVQHVAPTTPIAKQYNNNTNDQFIDGDFLHSFSRHTKQHDSNREKEGRHVGIVRTDSNSKKEEREDTVTTESDSTTLDSPRLLVDSSEHDTTGDDLTADYNWTGVNTMYDLTPVRVGYETSHNSHTTGIGRGSPSQLSSMLTANNIKAMQQQEKKDKKGLFTSPIRFSHSDTELNIESEKSMLHNNGEGLHTRPASTSMLHVFNNSTRSNSNSTSSKLHSHSASSASSAGSSARCSPDPSEREQRRGAQRKAIPRPAAFPLLTVENIKAQNNRNDVIRRRKVIPIENFKRNPSNDSFPLEDDEIFEYYSTPSTSRSQSRNEHGSNSSSRNPSTMDLPVLTSLGGSEAGDTMMMLGDIEL